MVSPAFRKRALILAAAGLALAASAVLGVLMLRNEFFKVSAVEFHGLKYIDEHELAARMGIPAGAGITIDPAPLASALEVLPGVRSVKVERRWPGTLVVRVVEAAPVAIAMVEDHFEVIDDRGEVLPYHPGRVRESLPIAPRDSVTAALLARMAYADPEGYGTVERVTRTGSEITLHGEGRQIHLRQDADAAMLRDLAAVRDRLAGEGIQWRALDARFRDRVFVRRGTA